MADTFSSGNKTAEICDIALNAFGQELPLDWDKLRKLLDKLMSDNFDRILGECGDVFFRYEEDLNALNYAYVLENNVDFSWRSIPVWRSDIWIYCCITALSKKVFL